MASLFVRHARYFSDVQVKDDKVGRACGMRAGENKCVDGFSDEM